MAETTPEALRTELIQTAAVAVKWVQALDRRHGHIAHHVKTTGGRRDHLVRDHAVPAADHVFTALPGERDVLLMVAAYAALGQVISNSDPAALIDLAEILHALSPSTGVDAADLEALRAKAAREQGGFAGGVIHRRATQDEYPR